MSNDGPYRENQKPTDTWRMEVQIRMRSGQGHFYQVHNIPDADRRIVFRDEHVRFAGYGSNGKPDSQFLTEQAPHRNDDRGDGARVVDISPEVATSEQTEILLIRVSEIESLGIKMINERKESEEITEKLRKMREAAAERIRNG